MTACRARVRSHFRLGVVALLVAASSTALAQSNAGDLDLTFGTGGTVKTDLFGDDDPWSALIQSDGRILVAGAGFALARYNSNGSLDGSFGAGGKVQGDVVDSTSRVALALAADGKILVAGAIVGPSPNGSDFLLVRYNADGSRDLTFGPTATGQVVTHIGLSDFTTSVAVQPDGKIVIAGGTLPAPGNEDFALLRYTAAGVLDPTFGNGGLVTTDFGGTHDSAWVLRLLSDRILVAGVGGPDSAQIALARYDFTGALDPAFGNSGKVLTAVGGSAATALEVQADGRIVVAGGHPEMGNLVVRYHADGILDGTFGAGGVVLDPFNALDWRRSLAIDRDGKILVGGDWCLRSTLDPGGNTPSDFAVVRYNQDGSRDTTFGIGGLVTTDFDGNDDAIGAAVLLPGNGTIVAVGSARNAGPGFDYDFGLARYYRVAGTSTAPGGNVTVQPVDGNTETTPVTLQFSSVTQAGTTHLGTGSMGPTPPAGFQLGSPPTYYEVATTAVYSGAISICIDYGSASYADESQLTLWHFEGGAWTNVTTSLDTTANRVCGSVTSLSPFAVLAPGGGPLLARRDSFLRSGADDTNEGANERLRIQSAGRNRALVAFDLAGVPAARVRSATLILTIAENQENWGPAGRIVDVHRVLADWSEGNGRNEVMAGPPAVRGSGAGVTWHCGSDADIANQRPDCAGQWNGGGFAPTTVPGVLHRNGLRGAASFDVTADVRAGGLYGWLIKKRDEGQPGQVRYYSREGAAAAGNPGLAPKLVLELE